ncbi:NAD(P)/FAD-dependent oxidoreductase [Streptomyces ipomoeae]|uniref:NAD(P)/FAD-dependent oxidoreductase n=1 Tax=Streptomyces ipomoeae TaxID=103232 RepID=UPI001147A4F6|nr:FAD-dependent oxidoreductase [Streptomyces ipomoeae]MDX2934497.1 FAD-dependent oxidoreductase [Streptomyces ipomoeae]TQE17383.1 FAD-binding oxidoreductase [Streptomyces ipomoeae]
MDLGTVAVIGGGIIGCLVARHIVHEHPASTVLLLDRDAVGCGASRRSAGLHFPRGADERVRRMSGYSQEFYEKLKADQPTVPIHPVGMSMVSRADREELERIYTEPIQRADAQAVPTVCGAPVRLPPGMSLWDIRGAHYADVHRLVQTLVTGLRPYVNVREGVRVTALEPSAHGVRLSLGTGERLAVDRAVLAPGPWLAEPAWADPVAPLEARVKKIVALHIDHPVDESDRAVVFHDEDAFLLPLAHRGHWLFSYTCQDWDVDPDRVGAGLDAHDVEQARAFLSRYAPALASRCTAGRVFCDAYSVSRRPLLRRLDPAGRVVFAGAAGGSGYRLAPAIAAEAVRLFEPSVKGSL